MSQNCDDKKADSQPYGEKDVKIDNDLSKGQSKGDLGNVNQNQFEECDANRQKEKDVGAGGDGDQSNQPLQVLVSKEALTEHCNKYISQSAKDCKIYR